MQIIICPMQACIGLATTFFKNGAGCYHTCILLTTMATHIHVRSTWCRQGVWEWNQLGGGGSMSLLSDMALELWILVLQLRSGCGRKVCLTNKGRGKIVIGNGSVGKLDGTGVLIFESHVSEFS
jgi:hypothetical protein